MRKILFIGLSVVVLYSILVYAYGISCNGPLNSSTNYILNSGVTPTESVEYYVGCALDDVSPQVRIVVTDIDSAIDVVDTFDYNVKNVAHYFQATAGHNYSVFVGSYYTTGYALCEEHY